MPNLRIGGRVGFSKVEDIENNFKNIDFPIELALPWKYRDLWLPMENRLEEVLRYFKNRKIEILSIHATQGRISEEPFLTWGQKTLELADVLKVRYVTIHPNQVRGNRGSLQKETLRFIKMLHRSNSSEFSLETFTGKRRLFRPIEILESGLSMTLDVAHIHDNSVIDKIIETSWRNVKILHLSAKGNGEQHLPIDDFCVEVLKSLLDHGWSGDVILEYLPWYHYRVRADIKALEEHIFQGKDLTLMPVSEEFKYDSKRWGFNEDGS